MRRIDIVIYRVVAFDLPVVSFSTAGLHKKYDVVHNDDCIDDSVWCDGSIKNG